MSDNSLMVSELPTSANIAPSDRVMILYNVTGTPSVRTINLATFSANLVISNSVPVTSSSNGVQGTICADGNYFYVCVANNVWKRSQLLTW